MNPGDVLFGRQIAAARILVSMSQAALAEAADVSPQSVRRLEANGINRPSSKEPCKLTAVRRALERAGVLFVAEDGVGGAGVRLRFNRLDTKQIGRWEGEGGSVADDDIQ